MCAAKTPGAGILPYVKHNDRILLLFHTTFYGKKHGTLVDCGGRLDQNDPNMLYCACREFNEETEGIFYENEVSKVEIDESERIKCATDLMYRDIQKQQYFKIQHPTSGYTCYITQLHYIDPQILNRVIENKKKKRQFMWIDIDDVIEKKTSMPLYKRIEAKNLVNVLKQIKQITL